MTALIAEAMANSLMTTTLKNAKNPPLHPIVGDRVIVGKGTTAKTWQDWQPLYDLPPLNLAKAFPPAKRVCIFAPHPDDEILGCGGLMQALTDNGNPIVLISVTNGTQSHPHSTQYPVEKLNQIRPQETQNALNTLGVEKNVTHIALDLPDGAVYAQQTQFFANIQGILHADDILVTVFCHDGHPDHEATGQVVSEFAKLHQMPCYQVLIWAWHWAVPNDKRIPWHKLSRLDLTPKQQHKKRQAIACFRSQILPDISTGKAPVLPAFAIDRIMQMGEVFYKNELNNNEPENNETTT